MAPGLDTLRTEPGVSASIIAAALGFTIFCVVALAVVLGWIGPGPAAAVSQPAGLTRAVEPPPAPKAPGLPVAVNAQGLEAGEMLVETPAPAARPAPMMPSYSPPAAPRAAPRKKSRDANRPRTYGQSPSTPNYTRVPHPADPDDPWPFPPTRR
jgi:hypothetical protein